MKIDLDSWKFKYDELKSEMEIRRKQEETFTLQKAIIKKENDNKESQLKAQIRNILTQFFMNVMAKQTKINKIESQEMLELLVSFLEYEETHKISFIDMLKTGKIATNLKSK